MRQTAISFPAQKLLLEGVISTPQEPPGRVPAVVVCHPHPLFQGNMEHPLVQAVCAALCTQGMTSLRFNFRGVGKSAGEFSNGQGELADIEAALKVASRWPAVDGKRVGLVGISFSAALMLRGGARLKSARVLALVSPLLPPAIRADAIQDRRPRLVLAGDADVLVPVPRLQELVTSMAPDAQLQVVAGATHTWSGHEGKAAEHIATFLAKALA